MMGKRLASLIAVPFLVTPVHALMPSAKGLAVFADSAVVNAKADSTRLEMNNGVTLKEVVVSGSADNKILQMRSTLNTVEANRTFISQNFSGSLMQTLSRLPGVKAMSVGSGESKPVIRGLGFNRVLVAENGIKHEGQQWGDDHGLEIDQFAVDLAEVVKGPAALTYGSDAIGGVVNLRSNAVPVLPFAGRVNVFARSNNASLGASVAVSGRNGRFWYKAGATFVDYADYKVPADSIEYYSYYIKLKNRCLRNTAGRELDGNVMFGYAGDGWNTSIRIADVNTKSGFFANAHGLEVRLSDIDYDSSRRDIDLPCHTVNHLSVAAHVDRSWTDGSVGVNVAYQNNRQRELSEPVSHGYMPIPPSTLERCFTKHTLTAEARLHQSLGSHQLLAGANVEWQRNRRGGWGFILPDFEQLVFGGYAVDKWNLNAATTVTAGVRFDRGSVHTHSYRDWYKTPVAGADSVFMERSSDLRRGFNSLTWSVGANRMVGQWVLKLNVGKSFRMPIAKELGMDGVNYSLFRYEKGNTALKPEQSYQVDAGIVYEHAALSVQFTPYVNYFPNYIYLNPTPDYREGLQLYYYTQARVLRWGFEACVSWHILPCLRLDAEGEYLYARQLSGEKKGYSLPFSTPWSGRAELRWLFPSASPGKAGFAAVEWQVVGRQNRIVPPEKPTDGHQLLNLSAGKNLLLSGHRLEIVLRCENVLGTRYFDHTSYYRLIGVPEPGRNVSLMAVYSF